MPNCDFYALRADAIQVMQFVFEETNCQVYESYSALDEELRQFKSVNEVFEVYDRCKPRPEIILQLYSNDMGGRLNIRRFQLDSKRVGPNVWRSTTEGWGLIQLYLRGSDDTGIHVSHTNHNTEKRAVAWEPACLDQLGPTATWNWKTVTAISNKINRHIRTRLAVSKAGSRVLLPHAFELYQNADVKLHLF